MYKVLLSRKAERFLANLSGKNYILVANAISSLAHDPYQTGCKKLKGYPDTFRIRAGNYRILYRIEGSELIVEVAEIGDRKDVYE